MRESSMKKRLCIWFTVVAIFLFVPALPARGERASIVIQGADAIAVRSVASTSTERTLTSLLRKPVLLRDQPAFRIILVGADANRKLAVQYPAGLFRDDQAPEMSEFQLLTGDHGVLAIAWSTDEYAHSVVRCGSGSDALTMTFEEILCDREHQIALVGLHGENSYFCCAFSTDLDGNTAASHGFLIWPEAELMMPQEVPACSEQRADAGAP